MVSKDQKKLNRVINFLKKGLTSLADDLEDTVKGINDFIKSLGKAQKDLKGIGEEEGEEVQTVSTSSRKVIATPGKAKQAAAGTLFSLLSGGPAGEAPAAPAAMAASGSPSSGGPPSRTGPPKAPSSGPPSAPSSGPPSAPSSGPPSAPPSRAGLPPAPKLPPASGGPPAAPPGGVVKTPSFAKRAPTLGGAPPAAPAPSSAPPKPPASMAPAPASAPKAGGGLSSLRDEMLEELTRLKKIMRGD